MGHGVRSGHRLGEGDLETLRSLVVWEGMGGLFQNHSGERIG